NVEAILPFKYVRGVGQEYSHRFKRGGCVTKQAVKDNKLFFKHPKIDDVAAHLRAAVAVFGYLALVHNKPAHRLTKGLFNRVVVKYCLQYEKRLVGTLGAKRC